MRRSRKHSERFTVSHHRCSSPLSRPSVTSPSPEWTFSHFTKLCTCTTQTLSGPSWNSFLDSRLRPSRNFWDGLGGGFRTWRSPQSPWQQSDESWLVVEVQGQASPFSWGNFGERNSAVRCHQSTIQAAGVAFWILRWGWGGGNLSSTPKTSMICLNPLVLYNFPSSRSRSFIFPVGLFFWVLQEENL